MNTRENHPAGETLTLWSLGDMGPEESARIASHIAGCGDCRVETAKIQATLECLRRDGDLAPSEGQLAAARLAARAAFLQSRRRPTWVVWAASAAAAILLAAVAGSLFGGSTRPVAEETATQPEAKQGVPAQPERETEGERGTAVESLPPAAKESVPPGATPAVSPAPASVDRPPDAKSASPESPRTPEPAAPRAGGPTVEGAKPEAPESAPKRPETGDAAPKPAAPTVAKEPEHSPTPAPAAGAPGGTGTVAAPATPEAGAQRTGVLPLPVIALSSFGSLKNAQIEWPDGRLEPLAKGRGLPWGTKVHVESTKAHPAVLVLDDGGVVTIPGGKATISAALLPQPTPPRHNPEAPAKQRRVVAVPRDRIVISPQGARVVYVSIPYGYGKVRVLNVGGLGLMVRGGTEVLLQFNAEGMAIGVAELSGDKDLLFYRDGLEAPLEIERGHSRDLLHPERPARPDAVKRAGDDLKRIRILHARESLQSVLDTARKSWPKATALTDQLSRLKVETLRLNSATLRQILEEAAKQGMSAVDGARVVRSVRVLDHEGRAHLGSLYYFLKLVRETASRGEVLQRELDEVVAKSRKKFAKLAAGGR